MPAIFENIVDQLAQRTPRHQPNYIEVWVEKDAVIGSLKALRDKRAVSLFPFRGNSTTSLARTNSNIGPFPCRPRCCKYFHPGQTLSSRSLALQKRQEALANNGELDDNLVYEPCGSPTRPSRW